MNGWLSDAGVLSERPCYYVEKIEQPWGDETPPPIELTEDQQQVIITTSTDKHVCPNTCAVCGDKAVGYHYDVGSCSGCKTFFRRTIQAERRFVCRYEGKCKEAINKEDRVRCRACRFDRCVDVGMNPLAITSVSVPAGNAIICAIMRKRGLKFPDEIKEEEEDEDEDIKIFIPSTVLQPVEEQINRIIDEMLFLDRAHHKLRQSKFNPSTREHPINVDWCLKAPSRMGVEYGEMPIPEVPPPFHSDFVLMEIRIRDGIPFRPGKGFKPTPNYKWWLMVDLVYTIEWLKALSFFHELGCREKQQLVKDVTFSIVLLTAAFYSYEERRSNQLVMPDGMTFVRGKLPQEAKQDRDQNFEIIGRMRNLKLDKREYVLLKGIIASDSTHDELSSASRRMLQEQRERFSKSLMSYLLAKRGLVEGPSAYVEMMDFVQWLTRVIKRGKDLFFLLSALSLKCLQIPELMDYIFSP